MSEMLQILSETGKAAANGPSLVSTATRLTPWSRATRSA